MLLVKIPSSTGTAGINVGTRKAPQEIAEAVAKKISAGTKGKPPKLEEVRIERFDLEGTNRNIYAKARECLHERCAFLGGDHSITYPLFRAFSAAYRGCGLVIFDAHIDCYRRTRALSNGSFLKALADEGTVNRGSVFLVGIRKQHGREFAEAESYAKRKGMGLLFAERIRNNFGESSRELTGFARGFRNIYVSFDIDVLDPASSGGISPRYAAEGGLAKQEAASLIRALLKCGNVRALDFVEITPEKDEGKGAVKFAAELITMAACSDG